MHFSKGKDSEGKVVKLDSVDAFEIGKETAKPQIHGRSWTIGDSYCIDLRDPYVLSNMPRKNRKVASLMVRIIACAIMQFYLFTNFLYELLIMIFENIDMTDDAFSFIDDFIYYGQFFIPAIVFTVWTILSVRKHKANLMFCRQMMVYYATQEEVEHFERTHELYASCPSCGAPRQEGEKVCQYCGTPLFYSKKVETPPAGAAYGASDGAAYGASDGAAFGASDGSAYGANGGAYGMPNGNGVNGNAYGMPNSDGVNGNTYGMPSGNGAPGGAYGTPFGTPHEYDATGSACGAEASGNTNATGNGADSYGFSATKNVFSSQNVNVQASAYVNARKSSLRIVLIVIFASTIIAVIGIIAGVIASNNKSSKYEDSYSSEYESSEYESSEYNSSEYESYDSGNHSGDSQTDSGLSDSQADDQGSFDPELFDAASGAPSWYSGICSLDWRHFYFPAKYSDFEESTGYAVDEKEKSRMLDYSKYSYSRPEMIRAVNEVGYEIDICVINPCPGKTLSFEDCYVMCINVESDGISGAMLELSSGVGIGSQYDDIIDTLGEAPYDLTGSSVRNMRYYLDDEYHSLGEIHFYLKNDIVYRMEISDYRMMR